MEKYAENVKRKKLDLVTYLILMTYGFRLLSELAPPYLIRLA